MDKSQLETKLAEAEAKIKQLTAVAEYKCSTWISATPNDNGNLASAMNNPMLGADGNVVKQKDASGWDVVAGIEQKSWVQIIPGTDKNGKPGWLIKLTGKADSDAEYEAKKVAEQEAKGTAPGASAKKEASTEVPF